MDTIQTQAAYIRLNTLEKTKGTTKNGHSTDTDSIHQTEYINKRQRNPKEQPRMDTLQTQVACIRLNSQRKPKQQPGMDTPKTQVTYRRLNT